MTAHFNHDLTTIIGEATHHCATHIADDVWTVSWLPGRWAARHAMTAIDIADFIATNPPLNDQRWRDIEHVLTSWGVDPACLDVLADPEPDTDEEGAS